MNENHSALLHLEEEDTWTLPAGQGTMVIRTWSEEGHEQPFRARLTFSDAGDEGQSVIVTADPEQVLAAVRAWLAQGLR